MARHDDVDLCDGHPTHRAPAVQQFVAAAGGRLRLVFLSPYSPELNPDELVWNNLKNHGVGRRIITGSDHLKRIVLAHMRALQRTPAKIRAMFQEPHVRYAGQVSANLLSKQVLNSRVMWSSTY